MARTDSSKDLEFSISRNFHFKNKFSKSSLEHIAYENLVAGDSTVDNRTQKQKWVQSLLYTTKTSISQILAIKRTGRNEDGQEISENSRNAEIEQLKLSVLHELGWSYSGSFLPNAEETYVDAQGKTRENGDSYPELSFFLTSRKNGDEYWYAASYGIMKSSESPDFGSYSYFATLDEALEFINDELLLVGRNALFKRIMHEEVIKSIRNDGAKNIDDELYKKHVAKVRPHVEKKVNRIISERLIQEKFHNVRRSTDIFVLPDLIEMFLLPMSDTYLRYAKQGEFREKKAREITDTVAVDLDGKESELGSEPEQSEDIPQPEDALRNSEFDAMRKNISRRNESQRESQQSGMLSDDTQAQDFEPEQGGNLFGHNVSVPLVPVTDAENLDVKPSRSPNNDSDALPTKVSFAHDVVNDASREESGNYQTNVSLPPVTSSIAVSGNVDEQDIVVDMERNARISVSSSDAHDAFVVVHTNDDSISVSSDAHDAFMVVHTNDEHNIAVSSNNEDTLRSEWDTLTIVVSSDVDDTFEYTPRTAEIIGISGDIDQSHVHGEAYDFDTIEVDVSKEVWSEISRDMNEFFSSDRLPVRTRNSSLAEDIDTFL